MKKEEIDVIINLLNEKITQIKVDIGDLYDVMSNYKEGSATYEVLQSDIKSRDIILKELESTLESFKNHFKE